MSDAPARLLVAGAAGLGKSRLTLKELRSLCEAAPWLFVWYLTPTVELAAELALEYGEGGVVIRGRTHQDTNGNTLRLRSGAVKKIAGRLPNIMATMCRSPASNCPHLQECPYFAQFRSRGSVFFMSHEYLFIGSEQL